MRKPSALPALVFVLIILVGFGIAYATSGSPVASAVLAIVTLIVVNVRVGKLIVCPAAVRDPGPSATVTGD